MTISVGKTDEWPLDFNKIEPGDYLDPDTIQKITNISLEDRRYGTALLKLRKKIKRRRSDLIIRGERNGLRFLKPEESVGRLWNDKRRITRASVRLLDEMGTVNTAGLSAELRALHEKRIQNVSITVVFTINAERKIDKTNQLWGDLANSAKKQLKDNG